MSLPSVIEPAATAGHQRLGGLPAPPMVIADHELAPWEKRCHATWSACTGGR
jgi:hypothetical protein